MIYGRLKTNSTVEEISERQSIYSDDIPLDAMPKGAGPFKQDPNNPRLLIQDTSKVNQNNTIAALTTNDADSIRSIRKILCEEARVSQWTGGTLSPDRTRLLNNETQANNLRAQLPVAPQTLNQAKLDRVALLRQQGQAYIQLGFIFQGYTWGCATTFDMGYMNLAGYLSAGNLLTSDSRIHLWDANGIERILTPLNAGKLAGALYQWLYLSQVEFHKCVNDVNALTKISDVKDYIWTTVYSASNLWNGDTWKP